MIKLRISFSIENIEEIKRVFAIYSENEISITETESTRKITIPKLQIQPTK